MNQRLIDVRAQAFDTKRKLLREGAKYRDQIRQLEHIIRYATDYNRLYLLTCGFIGVLFAGLICALYPNINSGMAGCLVCLGGIGWALCWLIGVLQIRFWLRTIHRIKKAWQTRRYCPANPIVGAKLQQLS